jgi:CDGSH-type Zn-finger protein
MSKPNIPDKSSKLIEMEPGDYYWCACGKSANQPFCDGSHKGTEFIPKLVTLKEKQSVYWCMCKHSKNGAFCDGTHKSMK